MARRALLDQFQLPNVGYIGCSVTLYVADGNGAATAFKATLYDDLTGTGTLLNPQTFDSDGKLAQPTYIDVAVVPVVAGAHVVSQTLGVVCPPGGARGDWATATLYLPGDIVTDGLAGGGTGDVYAVVNFHQSGVWATDSANANKLKLVLDVSTLSIAPDATESAKGKAEIATQPETDAGTDNERFITPLKLANSTLAASVATNTADIAALAPLVPGHARLMTNCAFAISVAGNAMTIALKTAAGTDPSVSDPVKVAFRSATLTSGAYVVRSITSALSLVISAGSTLGFTTSELNSLHIGFIDNAGTVELAVSKGGSLWLEDRVVSTTAEGGAGGADSGTTLYSAAARSNVACRLACIARITADASTAGNWTAAPSRIAGVSANEYAAYKNTCKAWVNFNGTGTVAIRDGFNVASITDNGNGDYTVNLLTAMADANYAVALSTGVTATIVACALAAAPTTSAVRVATYNGSFALTDCAHVHVSIVGGNQ